MEEKAEEGKEEVGEEEWGNGRREWKVEKKRRVQTGCWWGGEGIKDKYGHFGFGGDSVSESFKERSYGGRVVKKVWMNELQVYEWTMKYVKEFILRDVK